MIARARLAALAVIAVLVTAATLTSFAESYRGLFLWAHEHGVWAVTWPLMVDVFIAVGELALFVALADRWPARSRIGAWAVVGAGLAVSVAGNVGHVLAHSAADRATAAVPPLAAAAALAVGMGVLKRVVAGHEPATAAEPAAAHSAPADVPTVAADAESAARAALAASIAAGDPLSQRQLMARFGLSRAAERTVREAVKAGSNGHSSG